MQKVTTPQKPGWHAFQGVCMVGRNQLQTHATLFLVEKMSYGSPLGVRLGSGRWRAVELFFGEWWEVNLPWEG